MSAFNKLASKIVYAIKFCYSESLLGSAADLALFWCLYTVSNYAIGCNMHSCGLQLAQCCSCMRTNDLDIKYMVFSMTSDLWIVVTVELLWSDGSV